MCGKDEKRQKKLGVRNVGLCKKPAHTNYSDVCRLFFTLFKYESFFGSFFSKKEHYLFLN
jgi:hypothetical protein